MVRLRECLAHVSSFAGVLAEPEWDGPGWRKGSESREEAGGVRVSCSRLSPPPS